MSSFSQSVNIFEKPFVLHAATQITLLLLLLKGHVLVVVLIVLVFSNSLELADVQSRQRSPSHRVNF